MKLANLKCKEPVVIYGRNANGEPDVCFNDGIEYLFCFDEKKNDIFIHNDVQEVHFLKLDDNYTNKHFEILSVEDADKYEIDEFNLSRMKRLYKERYSFVG